MPMLGGPQTDYLTSLVTLNLGQIAINDLTTTNNLTLIGTLTAENTALTTANVGLVANNVTIGEIILNLIIPDPSQIAYLTSVSVANDAAITANNVIIGNNDALITTLTDQNAALAAESSALTADNVILEAIIAEVAPN